MAKADPVTWNFIRYRLTDPVSGVNNWHAEAFGLLVAERFYPDLVTFCREIKSEDYGAFRHRLNQVWSSLQDPSAREPRKVSERDIQAIAKNIPDARNEDPASARAVAAGTICMHLMRFMQSADRNEIARLAVTAYAGVFVDQRDEGLGKSRPWPTAIPFDEVAAYDAWIADAPHVQSELRLQNADLSFVETLSGSVEQRSSAVLRRAFAGERRLTT